MIDSTKLSRIDSLNKCPKCGADEFSKTFLPEGSISKIDGEYHVLPECVRVVCQTCGFSKLFRPLDSPYDNSQI